MVSSAALGPAVSRLPFAACFVAALAALALAVLLHHHARGRIAWSIEHRLIAVDSIAAERGHCVTAPLGTEWLSSHERPSPARLLEDGRDLGPANASHQAIREQGGGRFSVWRGQLWFSTSDGSDPRTNGRRYEIVWPRPIAAGWRHASTVLAALLGLAAAWLARPHVPRFVAWCDRVLAARVAALSALVAPHAGRRAWWVAAAIGGLAVVVRGVDHVLVQQDLAGHISGALVMGVPFSDAQGWDSQGASICSGHGLVGMWSARRPFYALALGALYTWTGPSASAVVVLHMLVGGLTAALVCRIGQRVIHPAVGTLAGVAFACDPVSIEYSNYVLTETLGTFLFVVCTHQLVVAVQEHRAAAAWWGGVALVLSNLTRTLTLPAMPLLALLVWWRGGAGGRGWRRGAWLTLWFALGFVLPLTAWIARQKVVHDLTTISDNTASGLYAAASPKYGVWDSMVDREAEEAGIPAAIKPRYDWFMARFREELAADPSFYARNVAASALEALRGLGQAPAPLRAALSLLLLAAWLRRLRALAGRRWRLAVWALSLAGAIAAVWRSGGVPLAVAGLTGLALATALRRDRAAAVLVLGLLGTVGAVALFALGRDHRLLLMISWMLPLGLGVLAVTAATALSNRLAPGGAEGPALVTASPWAPRWQRPLLAASLVFVAGNFGWLAWRNYVSPEPRLPPLQRPTVTRAEALVARLAVLRPELLRADERSADAWYRHAETIAEQLRRHGRFVVANARLGRHRYPVAGGIRVHHWARMFEPRDYDRTFTYAETALPAGPRGPSCILFAAPLPPADMRDVVLLGRVDVDPDSVYESALIEVLAWAPTDRAGVADPTALQVSTEPRHLQLVDGLRRAP
jgi:hypothetical protein